tara:strand:+ start:196 stop:1497 length:1302 start_codon:yes stop_codon:yes gene_type:complete
MDDQPNPRMIMRGGMMLPEDMVRSNTPFIPTREQQNQTATSAKVGVKPLSQRMSEAYDRMKNNEKESNKISRKDTVLLGKLVLEIEQVKNNLNSIENEFRSTFRKKAELDKEENELLEEEKERLTILGASFRGFRRRLGAITALLAGKQFLEGDLQGGFQNTAIALTSFLPDIIRIVSGVVLGRMLLGGRGMGAARGVATGGGRGGLLPMLLAGGGLLAAGTALGSRGSGDQRRLELTRRQAIPQLLSRNDVRRFRASSARFDDILTGISDKKNIRINPLVGNDVVDDIEEPKGFVDQLSDLGGGISNFFGGDDEEIEEEDSIENIDPKEKNNIFSMEDYENEMKSDFADIFGKDKLINLLPDDEIGIVNSNNILTTEGGESTNNIITIGSEDKQVSTGNDTPTTNSNVHVKSTFSDNSKISYILEYGAGAVV